MKAPDKICIRKDETAPFGFTRHWIYTTKVQEQDIVYIRKEALLEWAEKELERLYELIPDAHKVEDETATPMEMRYLGQYMQMESVIDKLNSL